MTAARHDAIHLLTALSVAALFGLCSLACTGDDDDSASDDADDDVADDDEADDDADDDEADDDADDDTQAAECGNGVVEAGEVCDDGNTDPDDGCSPACDVKRIVVSLGVEGTNYDLGRDNAGNIYTIWKDGNALHFGRIVDQQIVGEETVPNSSGVHVRFTRPRLAVRPDGATVHTSWISGTPGDEVYHVWRDEGGNWDRETAWSNDGDDVWASCPSLGVDLAGTVHIIAQKWWEVGGSQEESSILYVRKPAGGPWSAESQLYYQAGSNWRDTAMFTDHDGGVHGAWKSLYQAGKYGYAESGDSLLDHSTADIPVPGDESTISFGDTFVTDAGDVHHAACGYPNQGMWHTVRACGSDTFATPTKVGDIDNDEHAGYENPWPAVAVDANDRVFVAWAENRGSGPVSHVVLGQQAGGAWSTEDLSGDADLEANSKPAITASGLDVYLIFRGGDGEIMLAEMAYAEGAY